jgi:hypothetical protein
MADWSKSFAASYEVATVDRLTGEETGLVAGVLPGGRLSRNDDTETKESGSLSCIDAPSFGASLVRVYLVADFGGGDVERVALGTFVPTVSTVPHGDVSQSTSIELDGRLIELSADAFDAPLTVAAGADTVATVVGILQDAGFDVVQRDSSAHTISQDRSYGVSGNETKLSVVNDLLDLAGFCAVRCDALGRAILERYRVPSERSPSWSFIEGADARFLRSTPETLDASDVANVVRCVYESEESTVVGVATDDDPASPYSTVSKGRRITKTYSYTDGVSQAEADSKAAELLRTQQSVIRKVSISHVYAPVTIGDAVDLDYPSAGVSGRFAIRTQEITLGEGCLISAELKAYVR